MAPLIQQEADINRTPHRAAPLIAHINLARGYRGGERQTELLIRELASQGIRQRLVARQGEPLIVRLADVGGLERFAVGGIVSATRALRGVSLSHAHEGRCVQAAALAGRIYRIPYVITRRVTRPLGERRITRAMYRNAAACVGLSSAIAKQLDSYMPDSKAHIIPSAFTPFRVNNDTVKALTRQFGTGPIVGHVGALVVRHKGQTVLIETARVRPGVQFVFVGSGQDEQRLKALAEGLDNVHFMGQVEDVASHLAAFDVFAFPSLFEGLGSILLDAMYLSLPIVASDVDGIPDIIKHEDNGLLVPPGDPQAMTEALDRILGDQALQQRFALRNRSVIDNFSATAMAQRYHELYRSLLGTEL